MHTSLSSKSYWKLVFLDPLMIEGAHTGFARDEISPALRRGTSEGGTRTDTGDDDLLSHVLYSPRGVVLSVEWIRLMPGRLGRSSSERNAHLGAPLRSIAKEC